MATNINKETSIDHTNISRTMTKMSIIIVIKVLIISSIINPQNHKKNYST